MNRTRLSCHRFRSKEVRPRLSLMAYNLGTRGGGLFIVEQGESRVCRRKSPGRVESQRAGSKDGRWIYTRLR